ncbi:MAG TPA: AAA family ATPase [Blastocatellia bacterium]|jgi:ATP-dependent Clp protease ATP-binding subunit ClpA|nr:AAA family ATPase [Blastocatellia bacterium]
MVAQLNYFGENLRAAGEPEYTVLDHTTKSEESLNFEQQLTSRVVGQEQAVCALAQLYQVYQAGLNLPGRPIGTLLFLGPTGTGKTRSIEAAAEILFGSPNSFIRVDCAEFQHSHEIAKLIGSPPGYLGHRETPPILTQEHINSYHTDRVKLTLVLFDEIEKASDALWQLLLGVLDKATLTLGDNRRVDFSRTIVVMTSNLGARDMEKLTESRLGFSVPCNTPVEILNNHLSKVGVEAARKKFSPEFMNRIDKLVVFRQLSYESMQQILELELQAVQRRVLTVGGGRFILRYTDRTKQFLLREGTDAKYGARPLKRTIERNVVLPLSNLIATRQIGEGDILLVDVGKDECSLMFMKQNVTSIFSSKYESPFGRKAGAKQPRMI